MIDGARQLPAQHITIRVPWHDNGWNGTFCNNPCGNSSCTVLPRIAAGRNDEYESNHAGESIEQIDSTSMPPCIGEHGTIMAPFAQTMHKTHPYSFNDTHAHFADTPYTIRPYSAAAVPFRWMLREQVDGDARKGITSRAEELKLGYDSAREPDMKFGTSWVQQGQNQRILLDTFFSATKPEASLVFFYAKRTPLCEDPRRVIIGVGRVKTVTSPTEYRYKNGTRPSDKIDGYLWECNIEHSIRPNGDDGFILPYQELLELMEGDNSIDPLDITAFSPEEYQENFSYGSELLPQDGAIASLIALEKAIKNMRGLIDAPFDEYLQWIDKELNRLWKVRGAFPGFGSALNAFGLPTGNLLAWYLLDGKEDTVDPWELLSNVLTNPDSLPAYLRSGFGETNQLKWEKLNSERRALLMLLSRFNLSNEQAMRWYQVGERENSGIKVEDSAIIENPYQVYERDRLQEDAISFSVVDRGMFPPETIRRNFPRPTPSNVHEAIDKRRVRGVMIKTLEDAAEEGHTYLPANWLIRRVRKRPMIPGCPLDEDTLPIIEGHLPDYITLLSDNDKTNGFQLNRYVGTAKLISGTIRKRKNGKPNVGNFNWRELVDNAIDNNFTGKTISKDDEEARTEKCAALEELFKSRVSVLIGSAGTGKSTLLKALCEIEDVKAGNILLLAPTGKARVRLEQTSGMLGKGKTVAQFLNKLQRYDGKTGRYFCNQQAERSPDHKTVIIDECSMLTEEQLAAVFDAIKNVSRLILVGDPKQLPPIGAGRPYFDTVEFLKSDSTENSFPKVSKCYAELTVTMRQKSSNGITRDDVLFANVFSGRPMDSGADEIWHTIASNKSPHVKLVRWNQPEQLQKKLLEELVSELKLSSLNDEVGFEESLGGFASSYNGNINIFFNVKYKDRDGAAQKSENWQILSPLRQNQTGVLALNRKIQHQFRKRFLDEATRTGYTRKIPKPMGAEGIIYGDKVINVINNGRRYISPDKDNSYVANGDIGIVTGYQKNKFRKQKPKNLEVEFASQLGFAYKYWPNEFSGQESSPPLELAYVLTIHKTQGSEFGITFLIIPNPCRILSREMLYTALTRHKEKVIVLHQGDFMDLAYYSKDHASDLNKRMTNLFEQSIPIKVKTKNQSVFLDKNLIYQTARGDIVRSKSEWIIADKLFAAGIEYHYEHPLTLGGVQRYPDFTIIDDDSGVTWYWEHNGMLGKTEYRQRWERKLQAYKKAGILPDNEGVGEKGILLTTEEDVGTSLNAEKIDENIRKILGTFCL